MTLTVGPCAWVPTHVHHSVADLAEWLAYPANVRTYADLVGAAAMWAATGRRFDQCSQIARPVLACAHWSEVDMIANGSPPTYIDSNLWVGLPGWGLCCQEIDPARARLKGPVNSITSVTIDGVVVAPANYRLDEGWWLVRTDGGQWPWWQNIDLPSGAVGTFVVSYKQGVPIPAVLLAASGTYALEVARSVHDSTLCRLPSRASSITRQGITIELIDPTVLLQNGLTGISDIDALIQAYNPLRLVRPLRVLVPGATAPRVSV